METFLFNYWTSLLNLRKMGKRMKEILKYYRFLWFNPIQRGLWSNIFKGGGGVCPTPSPSSTKKELSWFAKYRASWPNSKSSTNWPIRSKARFSYIFCWPYKNGLSMVLCEQSTPISWPKFCRKLFIGIYLCIKNTS